MKRRFDPVDVTLCTLAVVGFLVILGAVGWGLLRGPEYASWVAAIGGIAATAIGAAGSLVRWLRKPSLANEEQGALRETTPPLPTPPPGGISTGRDFISGSHIKHTINSGTVLAIISGLLVLGLVIVALAYVVEEELAACERPESTTGEDLPIEMTSVVYTENVGLSTFCGPASTYLRPASQELRDGAMVEVVCKETDGQFREDPLNQAFPDGHPRESTVWYLLANGGWVSDMYVGTPKVEGDPTADGIPVCDATVSYETTEAD